MSNKNVNEEQQTMKSSASLENAQNKGQQRQGAAQSGSVVDTSRGAEPPRLTVTAQPTPTDSDNTVSLHQYESMTSAGFSERSEAVRLTGRVAGVDSATEAGGGGFSWTVLQDADSTEAFVKAGSAGPDSSSRAATTTSSLQPSTKPTTAPVSAVSSLSNAASLGSDTVSDIVRPVQPAAAAAAPTPQAGVATQDSVLAPGTAGPERSPVVGPSGPVFYSVAGRYRSLAGQDTAFAPARLATQGGQDDQSDKSLSPRPSQQVVQKTSLMVPGQTLRQTRRHDSKKPSRNASSSRSQTSTAAPGSHRRVRKLNLETAYDDDDDSESAVSSDVDSVRVMTGGGTMQRMRHPPGPFRRSPTPTGTDQQQPVSPTAPSSPPGIVIQVSGDESDAASSASSDALFTSSQTDLAATGSTSSLARALTSPAPAPRQPSPGSADRGADQPARTDESPTRLKALIASGIVGMMAKGKESPKPGERLGARQSVDEEKLRLTTLTAVNKWKKEAKTRVREKKVRAKTLKAFSMNQRHFKFLQQNIEDITTEIPGALHAILVEEALPILSDIFTAYTRTLGANNQLTLQTKVKIDQLQVLQTSYQAATDITPPSFK